jgi:hypothetical protein
MPVTRDVLSSTAIRRFSWLTSTMLLNQMSTNVNASAAQTGNAMAFSSHEGPRTLIECFSIFMTSPGRIVCFRRRHLETLPET